MILLYTYKGAVMDTKLTLKLKDDSISRAKKYVSSIGTSLSAIVEDFFDDETGRTNKYPVHEEDSVIVF